MHKLLRLSSRTLPQLYRALPTSLRLSPASLLSIGSRTNGNGPLFSLHATSFRSYSVSSTSTILPPLPDQKPLSGLSHVVGAKHPPLDERTMGAFFDDLTATYRNSPALISRHESKDVHSENYGGGKYREQECLRYSYGEFGRCVDALARGLLKRGVRKGDRIGVVLGNGSAYALLQWATAKIGAILVCINPAAAGAELLAALNLTSCSHLLIPPSLRKTDRIPLLKALLPTLVSGESTSTKLKDPACLSLKEIIVVDNTLLGAEGFREFLEKEGMDKGSDFRSCFEWEGEGVQGAEECSNDEVVNIQFTSGTTGLPKGVALTHRNILNNGYVIGECMALKPPSPSTGWGGEVLCNSPPLYHCFGIVLGNMAFFTHAACVVYPSESFDPALALRAVHQEKCTALHGVPTMFIAQLGLIEAHERGVNVPNLSDLGKLDFSSLRTGIAAGSPVPDEVMRRLVSRMNLTDLTITYGQTETSPATLMSAVTDPLDLRCTTVGRVLPHTHCRIVDPSHELYPSEDVPSLPIGTPGELLTGGYALMKHYWENPAETDKSMFVDREGVQWLYTGDQGIMDKDGFVTIVGRIKDIVIRGGENLFPVVIENRTLLLAGVADCSIVGVPDPVMGEVVGAFIQREDSEAGRNLTGKDITEHVKTILSYQSAPDWVWFMGEDGIEVEYPKTASGKIRKVELRNWAKVLAKDRIGRIRVP